MRVAVMLLALPLLLLSLDGSADPDRSGVLDHGPIVLVAPTNGTFLLGAFGEGLHGDDLDPSDDVTAGTHHTWDTNTTDCHRRLFADLDWRPTSATGDPDAPVDVPYLFEIGITLNGTTHIRRVLEPGDRISLGELPEDGDLTIRLVLRQGAAVDWSFTVYAYEALRGCGEPL